jgi:2-(1,2-epoxy-1,2-dihydrophenyl)acetyl-CoA isomerase
VRPADPDAPVLLQVSDQIAHVTLNNPRRKNAMSWAAWAALRDTARALADSSVRVVVITGAGTDFCAGADLSGGPSGRHALDDMRIVGDACLAVHRLPMPVVARVDGVAVGAGLNLALACDLVIASERSRFSEIFVRRGLSVDFGGSWLLPRLVGLHRAKELVLLGDLLDAPTAYEMGLLHRLVPEAELDATVDDLVARLAAGPPIALRLSKRLLNDSFQRNLDEAVDAEATAQAVNHATADTQEAAAAFLERREPRFRGV